MFKIVSDLIILLCDLMILGIFDRTLDDKYEQKLNNLLVAGYLY